MFGLFSQKNKDRVINTSNPANTVTKSVTNSSNSNAGRVNTLKHKQDKDRQVEMFREQFNKSKKMMEQTKQNYTEVLQINKKLTEGYKHNLQVIMELTQLLVEYRQFIDEISKNMTDLDNENMQNMNALGNMDHLRHLTSDKLGDIASGFDNQIAQIDKANLSNDMDTSMLKRTREEINRLVNSDTQQAIRNQIQRAEQNKQSGGKRTRSIKTINIRETGKEKGRGRGRGKGKGKRRGGK